MQSIILNRVNSKKIIQINPENPYLRIIAVEIPSLKFSTREVALQAIQCVTVSVKKNRSNHTKLTYPFFVGESYNELTPLNSFTFEIENGEMVSTNEFSEVELTCTFNKNVNVDVYIHYVTINYSVSIQNPFDEFRTHLTQPDNCKILFSAPFGQGKSTFLNLFFENTAETYEVFKLYPVNYSISPNEDIFRYIKGEILFQLLGKNLEFDKLDYPHSWAIFDFFKKNPKKLLKPLIEIFSKIEATAAAVAPELLKLAEDYLQFKKEGATDDKEKAISFLQDLYNEEGSIFEDNFYTQLIRQLVTQLRQKTKTQVVLLIDDTDRIDPEHIFRIFNVFAAHFDHSEYHEGAANKLGFDKIILVGDIENLKSIYAHRYGPRTNFNGYINKYYSKEPFIYDNNLSISYLVEEFEKKWPDGGKDYILRLLKIVVRDLAITGNLTLRELLKLNKHNPMDIITSNYSKSNSSEYSSTAWAPYLKVIYFLNKVVDIDSLVLRMKDCKGKVTPQENIQYDFYTKLGFSTFYEGSEMNMMNFTCFFKSQKYDVVFDFKKSASNYQYYNISQVRQQTAPDDSIVFNVYDLYEMFHDNLVSYREFGGIRPLGQFDINPQ